MPSSFNMTLENHRRSHSSSLAMVIPSRFIAIQLARYSAGVKNVTRSTPKRFAHGRTGETCVVARVIRDWLRAQLSLIEAGASTIEEVMLRGPLHPTGRLIASKILSGKTGLLTMMERPTEMTESRMTKMKCPKWQ